jgi:hypothetical protein
MGDTMTLVLLLGLLQLMICLVFAKGCLQPKAVSKGCLQMTSTALSIKIWRQPLASITRQLMQMLSTRNLTGLTLLAYRSHHYVHSIIGKESS